MSLNSSRKPYQGSRRQLVLAFDIGTTFSGISYSILDPGEVPKIRTVTTFPGQTSSGGDSKVPSILCYDGDGIVRAVGEEARQYCESGEAEENGWIKVEWFKLHLRPKAMGPSQIEDERIPPLPENRTVVDVLGDFLAYLYGCAKDFIQKTHGAGEQILQSVQDDTVFVLGHPNGWEGAQQAKMRQAAVCAGLVPDTSEGHSRVSFVTEGEASLHYCVNNGLSSDVIKAGSNVMIVDCGGGTIDLSSFSFKAIAPISVEEIAPTGCRLQGAVFVTQRAYDYLLNERLKGSSFDDPQDIQHIVDCFEKTIKRRFKSSDETAYIRFGTARDDDPDFDVKRGVLRLNGPEVSALFEPSLEAIFGAIEEQQKLSQKHIRDVFMVGGFAANDWLFNSLQERLRPLHMNLSRPDGYTNKAVADGGLSFYLDHFVSTRVARATYGSRCSTRFDPSDHEHAQRASQVFLNATGYQYLPCAFSAVLKKGTSVTENREFTCGFTRTVQDGSQIGRVPVDITCYRGADQDTEWTDVEPDKFETLCTVTADMSEAAHGLSPRIGKLGRLYYSINFQVVLLFGLTELKAYVAWMEKGHEKRTPATIVYDT
ncbi:hypothetical protein JAAARDRAFT_192677 [Jaapia argillacea MUCL 33604]|uniref:Uncharacterized protein n=1 Tax=Jaapia argillacea MUCL 33604 TaxID=933084 RepID=A0A067PZ09_9AGAM|nr:hypothetical protein JAAARDRAFT_192677 [Jaapia argillacea MUCL 33604]